MNNQKHTLKEHYGLFIGGQWRDASDKAVYTSTNPANGEILAQCAQATKEDVELTKQLLNSAAYVENDNQTLEALILEEAGEYFSGARSARETAERIQSRASLYINEQM